MVYIIEEIYTFKIGMCKGFFNRVKSLNTNNRNPLSLVRQFEGGKLLETYLHNKLREYQHNGEFFYIFDGYIELIDELVKSFYPFKFKVLDKEIPDYFNFDMYADTLCIDLGINKKQTYKEVNNKILKYKLFIIDILKGNPNIQFIHVYSFNKHNNTFIEVLYEVIGDDIEIIRKYKHTNICYNNHISYIYDVDIIDTEYFNTKISNNQINIDLETYMKNSLYKYLQGKYELQPREKYKYIDLLNIASEL